ncbi:hypothetical protein GQR58_003763 [Nymphon striatum]|nr:hypothetical protein GQR58_003763 [Nymphon striatum]
MTLINSILFFIAMFFALQVFSSFDSALVALPILNQIFFSDFPLSSTFHPLCSEATLGEPGLWTVLAVLGICERPRSQTKQLRIKALLNCLDCVSHCERRIHQPSAKSLTTRKLSFEHFDSTIEGSESRTFAGCICIELKFQYFEMKYCLCGDFCIRKSANTTTEKSKVDASRRLSVETLCGLRGDNETSMKDEATVPAAPAQNGNIISGILIRIDAGDFLPVGEKRSRGSQKFTWRDGIERDMRELGVIEEDTQRRIQSHVFSECLQKDSVYTCLKENLYLLWKKTANEREDHSLKNESKNDCTTHNFLSCTQEHFVWTSLKEGIMGQFFKTNRFQISSILTPWEPFENLRSWLTEPVKVGVVSSLQVNGINLLLGNDLAGDKVVVNPIVTKVQVLEQIEKKFQFYTKPAILLATWLLKPLKIKLQILIFLIKQDYIVGKPEVAQELQLMLMPVTKDQTNIKSFAGSAVNLYGNADLILQQDFAPSHSSKSNSNFDISKFAKFHACIIKMNNVVWITQAQPLLNVTKPSNVTEDLGSTTEMNTSMSHDGDGHVIQPIVDYTDLIIAFCSIAFLLSVPVTFEVYKRIKRRRETNAAEQNRNQNIPMNATRSAPANDEESTSERHLDYDNMSRPNFQLHFNVDSTSCACWVRSPNKKKVHSLTRIAIHRGSANVSIEETTEYDVIDSEDDSEEDE